MKIVVVTRCYNEESIVQRFLHGYDFADTIIVADGGSTDNSVKLLQQNPKVKVLHFDKVEIINGERWNPDNPHLNFAIDAGKAENPDWLILDDFDDVPNYLLRTYARQMLSECVRKTQVNAFRLYMWGENRFFPKMNDNFNPLYTSLWAWKPSEQNIYADENIKHGTIRGTDDKNAFHIALPRCLLHFSWHPDTIDEKIAFYNKIGIGMSTLKKLAGDSVEAPEWARV